MSERINAAPEKVWQTLTSKEEIKQFMFGYEVRCNWRKGDTTEYYLKKSGLTSLVLKGVVTRSEPPFYLEHTLFPAGWDIEQRPEDHITAVYQLAALGAHTELIISQGDFAKVSDGDKRYEEAKANWEKFLPRLKEIAELNLV